MSTRSQQAPSPSQGWRVSMGLMRWRLRASELHLFIVSALVGGDMLCGILERALAAAAWDLQGDPEGALCSEPQFLTCNTRMPVPASWGHREDQRPRTQGHCPAPGATGLDPVLTGHAVLS